MLVRTNPEMAEDFIDKKKIGQSRMPDIVVLCGKLIPSRILPSLGMKLCFLWWHLFNTQVYNQFIAA